MDGERCSQPPKANRARTLYELSDRTQVNAVFRPDGLRSFDAEWKASRWGELEAVPLKVLPLPRVIASQRAANRDKDLAVHPILERTWRLVQRLKQGRTRPRRPARPQKSRRSKPPQ